MVARRALVRAAVLVLLLPSVARGYDFSLELRTVGQGYQVRRFGATGRDELLTRRRFTQMLALGVWDIEPASWRGEGDRNAVYVDVLLRFERDLGDFGASAGASSIGELDGNQLQILSAVVGARDVGGRADLRLGRQTHFDLVDFFSFDGLHARVRLVPRLAVEAMAGTEVRADVPLASPIYELSGTSPGERSPGLRPGQSLVLRPLVGAAVAVEARGGSKARLSYRRSWSATADREPGEPARGVNEEKLALTADGSWRGRLLASVGLRWNLLTGGFDDQQLAVRWRAGERWWLEGQYAYLAPTFDGDSIWNVFAGGAFRDLRAGAGVTRGSVELHGRAFLRRFEEARAMDALGSSGAAGVAWGGNAGLRHRLGTTTTLRSDVYVEQGQGGRKLGADLGGFWSVARSWALEGRLTSYAFDSGPASNMSRGVVFGVQAGSRHELAPGIRLHVIGEDNMGTLYAAQLRVLAILEVDVRS